MIEGIIACELYNTVRYAVTPGRVELRDAYRDSIVLCGIGSSTSGERKLEVVVVNT